MSINNPILNKTRVDTSTGIGDRVTAEMNDLRYDLTVSLIEGGINAYGAYTAAKEEGFNRGLQEETTKQIIDLENQAIQSTNDLLSERQAQRQAAVDLVGESNLMQYNQLTQGLNQAPTKAIRDKFLMDRQTLLRDIVRANPTKANLIVGAAQQVSATSSLETQLNIQIQQEQALAQAQADRLERYREVGEAAGVPAYLEFTDPEEYDRQWQLLTTDHAKAQEAVRNLEVLSTTGEINRDKINREIRNTQASAMTRTRQVINNALLNSHGIETLEEANELIKVSPETDSEIKQTLLAATAEARAAYIEGIVESVENTGGEGLVDYEAIDKQLIEYDSYVENLVNSVGSEEFAKLATMNENILSVARDTALRNVGPNVGGYLATHKLLSTMEGALGENAKRRYTANLMNVMGSLLGTSSVGQSVNETPTDANNVALPSIDSQTNIDTSFRAMDPDATDSEIEEFKNSTVKGLLMVLNDPNFDENAESSTIFMTLFDGVSQDHLSQIDAQNANSDEVVSTWVDAINHPNFKKIYDRLDSGSHDRVELRAGSALEYEITHIFMNEANNELKSVLDERANGGSIFTAFKDNQPPLIRDPAEPAMLERPVPPVGPVLPYSKNPNQYMQIKRMLELESTSDGEVLWKVKESDMLDATQTTLLQQYADDLNRKFGAKAQRYIKANGVIFGWSPAQAARQMKRELDTVIYD